MDRKRYILAIDQGTSSTKTIVFDEKGNPVHKASEPLHTEYLPGGFVEQDPEGIYRNMLVSVKKCLEGFGALGGDVNNIEACGISNQRETFVLFDKNGKPLHNAVVWQCKRSIGVCSRLKEEGLESMIKERTGLIIDPYFSGAKVMWLYENLEKIRMAIDSENACFGTVDTWLLYKLTKGDSYFTDYTNASRTMFFNLEEKVWDNTILEKLGLLGLQLPKAKPSSFYFGETDFEGLLEKSIPISGMIGDSHAAAFGEGLYSPGTAKATLGTGCSILMNVGSKVKRSEKGMVSTICWSTAQKVDYALEGIIVSCGSTLEWLKKMLGIFTENKEIEELNNSVQDNNGVYVIPAFSGLGAPHWDMSRKASIVGLSFDCHKGHIVRATLESIAYQIKDVVSAMEKDSGIQLEELQVDGGISFDKFVMQFLADLLDRPVVNIGITDVSALGAAYLAGLETGVYESLEHLKGLHSDKIVYKPGEKRELVKKYYSGWEMALDY